MITCGWGGDVYKWVTLTSLNRSLELSWSRCATDDVVKRSEARPLSSDVPGSWLNVMFWGGKRKIRRWRILGRGCLGCESESCWSSRNGGGNNPGDCTIPQDALEWLAFQSFKSGLTPISISRGSSRAERTFLARLRCEIDWIPPGPASDILFFSFVSLFSSALSLMVIK